MSNGNELMVVEPHQLHKMATNAANACKEIVEKTAMKISGRKYVKVEGWQSIASALGCVAGSRAVEKVFNEAGELEGFKAIGEVKRQSDGLVIAEAEGFVGADEPTWFGGEKTYWDTDTRRKVTKKMERRPDYAIRAMAQTRAISRACRSAFAFVVVMISEDLDTTPAEEVDEEQHTGGEKTVTPAQSTDGKAPESAPAGHWQSIECTFGKKDGPLRGKLLGELQPSNLRFLHGKFASMKASEIGDKDKPMVAALAQWESEQEPAS